jgi:hypothetical protein
MNAANECMHAKMQIKATANAKRLEATKYYNASVLQEKGTYLCIAHSY